MNKTKVYDLPTRLFHWLFAATFLAAFFVAKFIDDDSPAYAYHMLLGLVLVLVVALRVIWGFVGSKYARFSSFSLRPNDLLQYFKQLFIGKTSRTLGHNPASSWAALIMLTLALGLGLTGYLMASSSNKEALEEVHEILANIFIVVALSHIAGVIFHMLRHRDGIALSIVHGKKTAIEGQSGINHSHKGIGLIFLAVVAGFVFYLDRNYDKTTQSLTLFGNTLQLSESENEDHLGLEAGHHDENDRDDNDEIDD